MPININHIIHAAQSHVTKIRSLQVTPWPIFSRVALYITLTKYSSSNRILWTLRFIFFNVTKSGSLWENCTCKTSSSVKVTGCDSNLCHLGALGSYTCGDPSWVLSSLMYLFRALRFVTARCGPPEIVTMSSSLSCGGILSCTGAGDPRFWPRGACPCLPTLLVRG